MTISPISFGSADFLFRRGHEAKDIKELDTEAIQTDFARKRGVTVPVYKATVPYDRNNFGIRYHVEGDPADPRTNPIEKKHLRNLFKNLYLLDTAGMYHNDLDTSHVFFSPNGKVEFDCFRYSFRFQNSPEKGFDLKGEKARRPEFMMPSNEEGFEYANLGEYFSKLKSFEKDNFIKSYLQERSYYHGKRAEFLIEQGFDPNSKTVRYEKVQQKVFENPSNAVLFYTRDKLELNAQRRKAFTMWDEGGGACGHQVDPIKRFESVIEHLNALGKAIDLRDEAAAYKILSAEGDEREYFDFEREYGQYWTQTLYDDAKGMGEWNFHDNKREGGNDIFLGCLADKNLFKEFYSEIDPKETYANNQKAIEGVKVYYKNLIEDWTPETNSMYRDKFYGKL